MYNNNVREIIPLTQEMVSGFDSSKTGEQKLIVSFGGKNTYYTVTINHNYLFTIIAPSCTEDGYVVYSCSCCGDSYIEPGSPAEGHNEVTIPAVKATCTEIGLTEGKKCSVCGEILEAQEAIAVLGHDWNGTSCRFCDAIRGNPFADVPEGSFYINPVLWAVENGITNGTSADSFNPDGQCQRAQVVTFLHRAAGNPEPISSNNPFTDVKAGDFYYKPVLWAVEKGITNGISATKFGSVDVCNRAAVVTFLWRAMGSPEPQSTESPFEDVKETDFYFKPVLWASELTTKSGPDGSRQKFYNARSWKRVWRRMDTKRLPTPEKPANASSSCLSSSMGRRHPFSPEAG